MEYRDPVLTVCVLDFCKPYESRLCLESIKRHVKIPHKVVFCDNGSGEDYPISFVREGLVDQLIVNRESTGLGLGTRDCMNASFSPYTMMMQNDQLFARDLTENDFDALTSQLGKEVDGKKIASINLAGRVAPVNQYSERGHIVFTTFYKQMERNGELGYHGAGKYHNGPWREAQIQAIYAEQGLIHWTPPTTPWVSDNGVFAVRDMGDSVYCHRTDTKALYVIVPPIGKRNPVYPKVSEDEWNTILFNLWPDGKIPEQEVKDSFDCWSGTDLAKMEVQYVADLRRRFKEKGR